MAGASDASPIAYYYCEVGVRERLALSRTSRPEERTEGSFLLQARFEPSVLRRLPLEERPGVRFAPEVAMFCFPHGVRLVTPEMAAARPLPVVNSFVLTLESGARMHGACIIWYEPLPARALQARREPRRRLCVCPVPLRARGLRPCARTEPSARRASLARLASSA